MDTKKIDELIAKIKSYGDHEIYVGGPIEPHRVDQVENALRVNFCSDYRQYLELYGNLFSSDNCLFGLDKVYFEEDSSADIRYQALQFIQHTGVDLSNRTVLRNESDEYYLLVNHDDSKVYSYDPFAKRFEIEADNLEQAIVKFLENSLKLAATA